nr:hypothetical protein [Mesorhizobium sp. J428]
MDRSPWLSSTSRRMSASDSASAGRVPDEIERALPGRQAFAGTGDGIAEDLLSRRQAKAETVAQHRPGCLGKRGFVDEAPPRDIAGIDRVRIRQPPLPDGRKQAVRTDQQIAFGTAAVIEMRHHGTGALFEVAQRTTVAISARQLGAKQPIEMTPGRHDLREFPLGDNVAFSVQNPPAGDEDADARPVGRYPRLGQGIEELVVRDDPSPARRQLAAVALEQLNLPAGPAQQKAREQP